ncbi:Early growth response protein 1 [Penicillium rolfsii]|nr:Early growth response protein 1 [Penicillium rolfsii]
MKFSLGELCISLQAMGGIGQSSMTSHPPEVSRNLCRALFQCRVCKKGYDRADQLKRHVRSHTTDKPFICQKCGKGFLRIELLKRHTRSHSLEANRDEADSCIEISGRASQACKRCASSKLKCDDDKPCRRCVRRNQICQWSPRDDDVVTPQSPVNTVEHDSQPARKTGEDPRGNGGVAVPSNNSVMAPTIDGTVTFNSLKGNAISPGTESFRPEWEGFNAFNAFLVMEQGSGQWSSHDSMGIDFGLTDEDLELLDSLNGPAFARQAQVYPEQLALHDAPTKVEAARHITTIDFQSSPLSHWTPCKNDNAHMDQQYLSLPRHFDNPDSHNVLKTRNFSYSLSTTNRDAAFALVVNFCQWKNLDRIMQCFPSTKLLDSLIHDFFVQHISEPETWIHEPTMDLNQVCPEMILTLAAAGAVLAKVEAIQRLGYAMLEVARLKVNSRFEDDNTLARQLHQQQMYTLNLQIGLWSGDKRRVEIAESCFQPVVTHGDCQPNIVQMLRRASRFKHEAYPIVTPSATDDESTVERKWRTWVEQESFKRLYHILTTENRANYCIRLAHYVFIHDAQVSTLRSTTPLISHMELDLPLPFSRKLWNAKTAAEWKAIYLQEVSQCSPNSVTLATILQDITSISSIPPHVDFQLAALVTIYGISNMVSDCNRILQGSARQWSTAVANLWQQELVQLLEQFQFQSMEPLKDSLPAMSLIYQTVSLSLYLPLGVLETFSGKDGEERSSAVYDFFIQKISIENLRKASWHAGQVLRIARSMPARSLVASRATCVYFSALALWSLATIFSRESMTLVTGNRGTDQIFFLDGEDDGDTLRRFIALGQGSPVLSCISQYVQLQDRGAVMRLFQQLFSPDHGAYAIDQQGRALSHAFAILGRKGAAIENEGIQY